MKARGRIFASGAFAGLAIAVAALIVLSPLIAARTDLRRIANNGVPVQAQLVELRTTVVEWQSFIERQLDGLTPGVAPDPIKVVEGGQLLSEETGHAVAMSRDLRRIGFTSDANDLDAAMSAFNKAVTTLAPVAAGEPVDTATLTEVVAAERSAVEKVWSLTTQIGKHLSQAVTKRDTNEATDHLALGFWLFVTGTGIAALSVLVGAAVLGRRAGEREREHHRVDIRHAYEARVQEALEMTKTEPDVYGILREALRESVPHLKTEMLIADSSRAHFRRALTNGEDFEGCHVVSPVDCPAATVGHALLFPSSRALNACPYLKARPSGECSAACLPVSIAGRTVGVTHATGPDGTAPTESDIETLNFTSRRGSERIAMIRAFATSQTQAQTDPLTGLLNRRSLQNAVRDLRNGGVAYSLAYGDLDHFKMLNDTHGHEAGDQALRLFARVLGDSLRPNDIAARYGGEEFVIVLPDCDTAIATGVLERVRESLALALGAGRVPRFTVTFGLASSGHAEAFDEIVAIADQALLEAKAAGRNRVGVADLSASRKAQSAT
jgi:diguanylate cyclase (GGDEF)-like protein